MNPTFFEQKLIENKLKITIIKLIICYDKILVELKNHK